MHERFPWLTFRPYTAAISKEVTSVLRRSHSALFIALSLAACGQDATSPISGDAGAAANFEVSTTVTSDAATTETVDAETTPPEPDGHDDAKDGDASDTPLSVDGDALSQDSEATPGDSDVDATEDTSTGPDADEDTTSEDDVVVVEATNCDGLDNGAPCEDGSLCTVGDTCLIGVCQSGEPTVCNGQGPCRLGTCQPESGSCNYVDAPEGDACEDEDACSAVSQCQSGLCVATETLECQDMGACQTVMCDPATGCVYTLLDDGTSCEMPCYDIATCQDGACVGDPSAKPPCPPAQEPCVDAWLCDPETGGCTVMIPSDAGNNCNSDGSKCTIEACDGAGTCAVYEEDDCEAPSALDPCWNYTCEPDSGCVKTEWAPTVNCPGPPCGDGFCFEGETCFSCPFDCGECCGDDVCTPAYEENCVTCGEDCGECCGNGLCDFGETCFDCETDCGQCCGDGTCDASHLETCLSCAADCGECCGNGNCDFELGESCFGCPGDCGDCCGNGQCDFGETCLTCENDCGACCASGTCNPDLGDTCQTCPEHCGECCGNGTCDANFGEDCAVCEADCGACCGDGTCDPNVGETCGYCPEDCGSCCGNAVCDPGESCSSCQEDCGLCACGNGLCCGDETCETCAEDCGACAAPDTVLGPCSSSDVAGITRDCGWTYAGDQPCSPGEPITIACHEEAPCNLGSCQGDAMLRVCDGTANGCTASEALAQNDNACGTDCPYLTFVCPASGQLSVLTAPHVDGEPAQCIWSTYPESPDATLPCAEDTCGPERECGWVRATVTPCTPGIAVEIGCGGGASCGLGSSEGDPMIRVCAGDHQACDAGTALANVDDVPGCGFSAGAEYMCPESGAVTILTAPKCSNEPHYSCDLCAACPSCTPPW